MRYALPIWHCLDYDTQVKLAPMLNDPHSIAPPVFKEWPELSIEITPLNLHSIEEAQEYYDKFMKQKPNPKRILNL